MKTFKGYGKATLMFENCNDHGSIQISLNNKTVQATDALTRDGYIAEFVYNRYDTLVVKAEKGAIIKISSLNLTSRKYFLSIKAILIIEIFCSIFVCVSKSCYHLVFSKLARQ